MHQYVSLCAYKLQLNVLLQTEFPLINFVGFFGVGGTNFRSLLLSLRRKNSAVKYSMSNKIIFDPLQSLRLSEKVQRKQSFHEKDLK